MPDFSQQERQQLRRLLDESACRTQLERYSHVVDWMDWATLPTLFWPDAELDFGMWSGNFTDFIPWVSALEAGYQRRLHLFCLQTLSVSGDRARAEVGMTNHLRLLDAAGVGQDDILFGRYQFGLERRAGEWRLSSLRFLLHGAQRLCATDSGGAAVFADGLSPAHPLFQP